jgi:hypothetical protein
MVVNSERSMKDFINQMFYRSLDALRHKTLPGASPIGGTLQVIETLERVIDDTDRGIRFVHGYRGKLQDAIAKSLAYTDDLVGEIPPAIEVSRKTFVSDPYVNAFFANVNDLQAVIGHSSEMRDFINDFVGDEVPYCHALLCMYRSEKTIMGMALEAEMLKCDVQQTAVSFSDHRIYSPAPTEADTRSGLRQWLFEGLVTHALGRIMQTKVTNHNLQHARQMLQVRLRRLRGKMRNLGERDALDPTVGRRIQETWQELQTIEEALLNSERPTPRASLEQVNVVLSHPDDFIRIKKSSLRLNKMGIRIDEHSSQPSNKINLTEVIIGDGSPRVVILAKFSREELLARLNFRH